MGTGESGEEALAQERRVEDGTVGDSLLPANLHYATQDEKDKARTKVYAELAEKYAGTQEGDFGAFAPATSDAVDRRRICAGGGKAVPSVAADAGPK